MLEDYFEPIYFYDLAKEIVDNKLNCEWSAIERTVIDRIYYAVFFAF